jgi:hypothetical protein
LASQVTDSTGTVGTVYYVKLDEHRIQLAPTTENRDFNRTEAPAVVASVA